ncbi:MAG: bifunctional serine/threonine-protein kinase/formylglycine-generating enzyme family protein [Myxococcota bacterium]
MGLGPEDRALAAYLLVEEALSYDELRQAIDEAEQSPKSLEQTLVLRGALDADTVEALAEQARSREAPSIRRVRPSSSVSVETPWSDGSPSELRDGDTLFDIPPLGREAPLWGGAAAEGTSDLEPTRPGARLPDMDEGSVELDAEGVDETDSSPPAVELSEPEYGAARFKIRRELGRGGMGRVVEAFDEAIGREVALKVLLPPQDAAHLAHRRFWTEVQATGQLEHPSIIPVHDVGRLPSGELFYVMKKLTGRTLADILRALRREDESTQDEFARVRLLTIFQQIAYAVAFAHSRGVVHRDIKPANIMVGRFGEAILIDWGLAKVLGVTEESPPAEEPSVEARSATETASGTITGTPQYMSPEATEGDPRLVSDRSDVYGLGVVLYEILTLEPAFEDRGFVPTVMQVREGNFVSPRSKRPELSIPEELDELCIAAMALRPEDRPSAKDLADDLGRILEGARERERRVRELQARLREGRAAADRWKVLKLQLQQAETEAKRLRKEVPPWAGLAEKQKIWGLEDRVSELKVEAVGAFEEAEAAFLRALGEVSDDREARNALASLYFSRFCEAERSRDADALRYFRRLVARYDDGAWEALLEGRGTIEVTSRGPKVEIEVAALQPVQRVLQPGEPISLGPTPTGPAELSPGSYLLTHRSASHPPGVVPILMGRTQSTKLVLQPRTQEEIGPGFVHVPEGAAIIGGDSVAHGSLDRQVVDVPEFAIARFPVTCDAYVSFLNGLAERDLERAKSHVPRARAHEGFYWHWSEERSCFELPETSPGGHKWTGDLPVNGISAEDALAYIEWTRETQGLDVRLPTEIEWEKAARGVDGRFFPWGDEFDPNFCKMKDSRAAPYPEPEPVGAFPIDCSVYGARDMAGGIRELCWGQVDGETRPVMRGGCWHDTGLFCRVAFRHVTQMDFVNTGLGFRLAKSVR